MTAWQWVLDISTGLVWAMVGLIAGAGIAWLLTKRAYVSPGWEKQGLYRVNLTLGIALLLLGVFSLVNAQAAQRVTEEHHDCLLLQSEEITRAATASAKGHVLETALFTEFIEDLKEANLTIPGGGALTEQYLENARALNEKRRQTAIPEIQPCTEFK